ncbi:MAG: VWA domain-containing protein [Acidobacteriota bacterium]|nr:VWA domain-containing protein [Acidobacteriota bacterium]
MFVCLLLGLLVLAPASAKKKDPRYDALSDTYKAWLEKIELLIADEEREAFLQLEEDYQRDAFIERFWKIRDLYPDTTRNETKERWETLLEEVIDVFGSMHDQRSEMVLLNEMPDSRIEFRCTGVVVNLEAWYYRSSTRVGYEFFVLFYQRYGAQNYHLWRPGEGLGELLDNSAAAPGHQRDFWQSLSTCQQGDIVERVIRILLSNPLEFDMLEAKLTSPAVSPSPEWIATFDSYSTELPENAEVFAAELLLDFPSRYQTRTVMQGTVKIDPTAVGRTAMEGHESYDLLLSGEILRKERLFENFRYKFDFPATAIGDAPIPMSFERRLRPGSYKLIVKVEDLASGRYYREARDIDVPDLDRRPRPPPDAESAAILEAAAATLDVDVTTIQIVQPRGDMHSGMVRFNTLTTGDDIAEVVFILDETTRMRKRTPPWSLDLDLGRVPQTRQLQVVAVDAEGNELARDQVTLNGGVHRFGVQLTEPLGDQLYEHSVAATAALAIPEDSAVDKVEFYFNEDLVATLFQPPFTQEILLPTKGAVGYVRAVAYQPDGNSTEDLVFVNAPDLLEEVEVEFVELYTTVLDKENRPVLDLAEADFTAFEDGVEQSVVRFDLVRDLPIHAGIMLDTSASMEGSIDGTKQAALQFFRDTITPKDRAALVTFSDYPNLAMKFSNEIEDLAAGLGGIKAERGTALYDSLIFALYYFNGVRGQRVLLLLSDGKDEASRFSYDDALEYARRTGVAIYAIGLQITGKGAREAKGALNEISKETGGRSFFIESVDELGEIYAAIQAEIRSRYLIGYQSSNVEGGRGFREVSVAVGRGGLKAKTMSGYYP